MKRCQSGALSLWWCAILVGLCTAAALAGLFAMRYGCNPFAERWSDLQSTAAGLSVQRAQSAATSVLKGHETALRKCNIDGAVVYSNVDCHPDNPTSHAVEFHDTRGIESSKVQVAAPQKTGPSDNLQLKALDRAIDKATGNPAQ